MLALQRRCRAALLVSSALAASLACTLQARSARASDAGEGVGFGPMLVFTADDSIYLGWELAASKNFVSRGSLGGAYRISQRALDPSFFHYLAWEPWVYVGATLGLALTDQQPRVMYGAWEALGQSITGNQSLGGGLFDSNAQQWAISVAVGWRGLGGTQSFYFTPKLWRIRGWDFSS